jgi:hypothetical protein
MLYRSPWITLGFSYLLLSLAALGTKGKKDLEKSVNKTLLYILAGTLLFFGPIVLISLKFSLVFRFLLYLIITTTGFLLLVKGGNYLTRLISMNLMDDVFNEENESFQQEEQLISNEYSFNLPTKYQYKGTIRNG